MVDVTGGRKVYQGVELGSDGRPRPAGWKIGNAVQRTHTVHEDESGVYVVSVGSGNNE